MRNLIRGFKTVGYVLSNKQVQAVICSLPHSWEHMKVNLIHNEIIITFDDISFHLELEDECLEAAKSSGDSCFLLLMSNSQNKLHQFKNDQAKNSKKHGKNMSTTTTVRRKETMLIFASSLRRLHLFLMLLFMFPTI